MGIPLIPIPTAPNHLVQGVNGKVKTLTLSTSHVHANNIIRDLLMRMDPFHHYGYPIHVRTFVGYDTPMPTFQEVEDAVLEGRRLWDSHT